MSRTPNAEIRAMTEPELEHQLIASLLTSPHLIPSCVQIVDPADFWDPDAETAFRALIEVAEREVRVDPVTVADRASSIRRGFDRRLLMEWMATTTSSSIPALAAERVHRLAVIRQVRNELVTPRSRLINHEDPWEVARDVHAAMGRLLDGTEETGLGFHTASEVMDRDASASPWVIPGLLRAKERMIFVAGEGVGKSMLVSQLCLAAEAGLHPFTRFEVEPKRVFRVDLENPAHAVSRSVRLVVDAIRNEPGMDGWSPQCPIWEHPAGLDLLSAKGQRLLVQAIRQVRPEILFIGPLYKMFRVAPGERADSEAAAAALTAFLDDVREEYGVALWIEAHAPKGEGGKHRDLAPIGSSLWYRWPEYGRNFRPAEKSKSPKMLGRALDVGAYRGDREPVSWPSQLAVGHRGWPFTGYYDGDIQLQVQGFRQ